MKHLSAPKNITWWIALILAVVGIILHFVGSFSQYSFWVVIIELLNILILLKIVIPVLDSMGL